MIRNKRILITGGGGFIGSALARRLSVYNRVTLLDTDFAPAWGTGSGIRLIRASVLDRKPLIRLAKTYQIIIHTAARVGVKEVHDDIIATLNTNYSGTANILEAAHIGQRCERLVCFSTSEVFGANAHDVSEDGTAVFPNVTDTRWCYGAGKLAAEQLAMGYHYQFELPVTVVRPFNVFGEGRTGDHAVSQFISSALSGKDIIVHGDGKQVRAWCHINDFCDAILHILDVDRAIGKVFNVGNPRNAITILNLARLIRHMCSSDSDIVFNPSPFTDIDNRTPDITQARLVLGFAPRVSLKDGLKRTIEWVQRNGASNSGR